MKNLRVHDQKRSGQSLVEALVALSILMTALVGIEALLTRSFLLDRVTADQTKATYLASEGIEIMKSLLDHQTYFFIANQGANGPDSGGWTHFCNLGAGQTAYYEVDWTTTMCPSPIGWDVATANENATPLLFDAATGVYGYNDPDGVPSEFTRVIEVTRPIDQNGMNNEIDVMSTVTWSTGSVTNQSLTIEDHFYNWNQGD